MIKNVGSKLEIKYVLDNLRKEDEEELSLLYGLDWKDKVIFSLKDKVVKVLYGFDTKKNKVPIAIGNCYEPFKEDKTIACVWLLATPLILKNKRIFFNEVSKVFLVAEQKYNIMFNFIYKSNVSAKSWLKRFGFRFDNPKPSGFSIKEDFEFFYKLVERGE